jgi:hypothetical protein
MQRKHGSFDGELHRAGGVRGLRFGGLPRPHLLVELQVRPAAGPRDGAQDHGEPQEALVSCAEEFGRERLTWGLQGAVAGRGGSEPAGDGAEVRAVRDQDAPGQGPRECPAESGGGPHGHHSFPELHQDQHVLVGQDQEDLVQEEKIPDQAAPRRIRELSDLTGLNC